MRYLVFSLFLLLLSSFSYAEYYADLEFDVSETGDVTIEGLSNHPELEPGVYDIYTSKEGSYWLLNISVNDVFVKYIYDVQLPENSVVNHVKVHSLDTFEDSNGLRIKGAVENETFDVLVQYKIKSSVSTFNWFPGFLTVGSLLIILVIGFIIYKLKGAKKKTSGKSYDRELYSDREYQIIELLLSNGGHMSQAELQERTELPKASLSRNVASLVRKEIVEKFRTGMTNKLKLK